MRWEDAMDSLDEIADEQPEALRRWVRVAGDDVGVEVER